jgi:hypothetical protein
MFDALARSEASVARAQGRQETLAARLATLTAAIELAKGRLAQRAAVEGFVEELHNDISLRSLATFETLLTALVQEVLPGEKPVVLDLSTERGLAALDVCLARPDGTLEDVLDDNGGAVTNVIGMALRLIAVVKAGAGRFLALDEADCWIAPDRVPAFYRVLEDAALRLNVQCLAVSHHDVAAFDGALHVARVAGDAQRGVDVLAPDPLTAWDDEQPGLRFIRLRDVQGYKDATLHLSPGVNALIGPNNRGKSTFIRALRAVFYGEARDSLVRAGEKVGTVEIGLAGGRTLRFTRQPRRSPVNMWSLHELGGSIVETDGLRYETGGRAVPPWVSALVGIAKIEDLDVHIAHQKVPVFLLGEPASRRSAVLSIGQEAGYVRDMLVILRERAREDDAFVRTGERELALLAQALALFGQLAALRDGLIVARGQVAAAAQLAARLQRWEAQRTRLGHLASRVQSARDRARATACLPGPDRLAGIVERVRHAREQQRIGVRLVAARAASRAAAARRALLAALPGAMPELHGTPDRLAKQSRLRQLRRARDAARRDVAQVQARLRATRLELNDLLENTGGLCPTCGAPATAAHILEGATDHERAAA